MKSKTQIISYFICLLYTSACTDKEILILDTTLDNSQANLVKNSTQALRQLYKFMVSTPKTTQEVLFAKNSHQRYFELLDSKSRSIIHNNELNYRITKNNPPLKGLLNINAWQANISSNLLKKKSDSQNKLSPFLDSIHFHYVEILSKYSELCFTTKAYVELVYKIHFELADRITRIVTCDLTEEEEKIIAEAEAFLRDPKKEFKVLFCASSTHMAVFFALQKEYKYFNLGLNSFKDQFYSSKSEYSYYTDLNKNLDKLIQNIT